MSTAADEIARDDQSGEALAERWSIEYLRASAVAVDPRALSLLERADCKRLRAIPLATGASGALVAVCAPSEERFASIRELTGEETRFVLISEGTLDALLSSRMFADASAKKESAPAEAPQEATPEPAADQVDEVVDTGAGPAAAARHAEQANDEPAPAPAEEELAAPEAPAAEERAAIEHEPLPAPAAKEPAPASEEAVENIVGAVLNALKHRAAGAAPELPVAAAAPPVEKLPESTTELLAHLDAVVEQWSSLRATLASVHAELEETKHALRETKEQLSVAHADNDQHRKRVRTLEGELAESRSLVTQARSHLQEAADLLEADPTQIEESAEFL